MKYAQTSWTPSDIQTLAPRMSLEEAEEWLKENEGHVRDRVIEQGWEVISSLLACDGIDTSDEE